MALNLDFDPDLLPVLMPAVLVLFSKFDRSSQDALRTSTMPYMSQAKSSVLQHLGVLALMHNNHIVPSRVLNDRTGCNGLIGLFIAILQVCWHVIYL